ncbi:hypothetical protein ZWY2020_041991 [Hordeum vulgare]|nr:hypothetical protein ZWY2020_041991 [Hordeum vulgare]
MDRDTQARDGCCSRRDLGEATPDGEAAAGSIAVEQLLASGPLGDVDRAMELWQHLKVGWPSTRRSGDMVGAGRQAPAGSRDSSRCESISGDGSSHRRGMKVSKVRAAVGEARGRALMESVHGERARSYGLDEA